MAESGTIFETCMGSYSGEEDRLLLMQCISSNLESGQQLTDSVMRSYLLVLSGSLVFFMQVRTNALFLPAGLFAVDCALSGIFRHA